MKKITILTHQGLGDLILCNAIIRNYAKEYDFVYVIAPENNHKTIQYMYRDLKNVEVIYIDWGEIIRNYYSNDKMQVLLSKYDIYDSNFLKIGFVSFKDINYFDEFFYNQIGLDFEKRWKDFYFERDNENELKLFNSLGLNEENYILVNNQSSIGILNIPIDSYIKNKDKKIIFTSQITNNIFDWCYVIENALEIHTICSAFKHLMDSLDLSKCDNLVYYYSIKHSMYSKSKNNWKYV